MSSRVFVALAPGLFALAINAAERLSSELKKLTALTVPLAFRMSLGLLWLGLLWAPLAQALNYTTDWRARHTVDLAAKSRIGEIERADLFLFNHYVEWLDPLGIMAAGAPAKVLDWSYLHVPAWLPLDEYEHARWIYPGLLDLKKELDERDAHIYWLSPESTASKEAREILLGDLSWTRKPLGLFSPIAKGLHNRPEDHRMAIFKEGPSPLEEMMAQGDLLWSESATAWQVPPSLFELPRRLFYKIPVIERFRYKGRLVHLPAGRLEIQDQDPVTTPAVLEEGDGQ